MSNLGEEYPKEQARLREAIGIYKSCGPAGDFAVMWMEDLAKRADKAAIEGDLPAMIGCFKEMQEVKL